MTRWGRDAVMIEVEEDSFAADPIGSRLKAARERQSISLEEIAAKTRVPIRHLEHIENGEWEALPAPTYSIGFARAYANAVGLNGSEIGAELRAILGRPISTANPSYYEPADPGRVPPRSLAIIAAAIAILLAVGYLVWRSGAVDDTAVDQNQIAGIEAPAANPGSSSAANQPGIAAPPAPAAARGPVVLTATDDVWLRIYDGKGGPKLFENTLKAGERFEVPAATKAPLILTGRPNALRIAVGPTVIAALGPAEKTIADVSLLPADLIARGAAPAPGFVPPGPAMPHAGPGRPGGQ
ncbi:MAG: helix-turn-helix protein [Alphaproteobacteria bacterium]|nr:helix-turn-helix protein [Alphaproteobacteria bacterium]